MLVNSLPFMAQSLENKTIYLQMYSKKHSSQFSKHYISFGFLSVVGHGNTKGT